VRHDPFRIAVLGGIPASLGGGGLEIQRDATVQALRAMGHDAFNAAACPGPRPFDLLHVFGSEVDAWHVIGHWRRNRAPLVVSPVVVVAPAAERRLMLGSRVPRPKGVQRMRVELLRRADLLVALTDHERDLLGRLAPRVRTVVIGNGVEPRPDRDEGTEAVLPSNLASFVLLVGNISPRKRQNETVRALAAAGIVPVIAGGFHGSDAQRWEFDDAVRSAHGVWVKEQSPATVRSLMRKAEALIHLSEAEGQSLAILESLAEGTPVICSDLPANRELAVTYPGWLRICRHPSAVAASFRSLVRPRGEIPDVPSWAEVAVRLAHEYCALLP
jgi:glycosyltransferase involved in cell wall biosynthesis